MENKNKGLIVLIILLIIIVMCLGIFIVYDKYIDKKECVQNKSEQIITSDENTESKEKENNNSDNKYELYLKNLKNQFSKYDVNNRNTGHYYSFISESWYGVYLTENQELYINKKFNEKYKDYKIDENVLSFYVIEGGNGGHQWLYFINNNGDIKSIDLEYEIDEQTKAEKIEGYKNIVSIVGGVFGDGYGGARCAIFIDIDGNIFTPCLTQ